MGVRNDRFRHKFRYLTGDDVHIGHAVIDIVNLSAAPQLTQYRFPDDLIAALHDKCLDRHTVDRRLLQYAHIPDPDEAHMQRPRDRRRSQRKHVNIIF